MRDKEFEREKASTDCSECWPSLSQTPCVCSSTEMLELICEWMNREKSLRERRPALTVVSAGLLSLKRLVSVHPLRC